MTVACPECGNSITIQVDEVDEGETLHCDECGLELEIVSLDPPELAPVEEGRYDEDAEPPLADDEEE